MWPQEKHLSVRLIGKKGLKIGLWNDGKRSCGLMSPDLLCSRVIGASG